MLDSHGNFAGLAFVFGSANFIAPAGFPTRPYTSPDTQEAAGILPAAACAPECPDPPGAKRVGDRPRRNGGESFDRERNLRRPEQHNHRHVRLSGELWHERLRQFQPRFRLRVRRLQHGFRAGRLRGGAGQHVFGIGITCRRFLGYGLRRHRARGRHFRRRKRRQLARQRGCGRGRRIQFTCGRQFRHRRGRQLARGRGLGSGRRNRFARGRIRDSGFRTVFTRGRILDPGRWIRFARGRVLSESGPRKRFARGRIWTEAVGDSSHAEGSVSIAGKSCQHAHASGMFAAAGNAQQYAIGAAPRDKRRHPRRVDDRRRGSVGRAGEHQQSLCLAANKTYACLVQLVARAADGTSAFFLRQVLVKNVAAVVSLVGSAQVVGVNVNPAGWAGPSFAADDTNKSLQVLVAGAASTNIRWCTTIHAQEVGYN